MKKKLINTLLVLTLAAVMSACGTSKEVSVEQTSIKAAAKAIGGKSASVKEVSTDGTVTTDSTVNATTTDGTATEATTAPTAGGTQSDVVTEDYLIYNNVSIIPGGDVAPVLKALGAPDYQYSYKYCGTNRTATDYYYDGLEIFTAPDDQGVSRIYMIRGLDCQSSTAKGASLCQDLNVLKSCYGTPSEQTSDYISYKFNGFTTTITLDGGYPAVIMFSTLDQ
ncbi:MAG: hypothetical protein J6Y86_01470 [Pseudobutyrivibrio sp.]|nr:hypothetical protein [Pseudobutyrivibrio sp.]